ncbi:MAG: sigma-70 family RNA polymerase sigma factor [Planctomycetes bacterium]|nr:sigma-70 family RNA polymerase sigma factor [Planctomycetota bacterium]
MTQRPHDATVLLEHAAFLRGLARSLVFDVDAADDVEQETWRAALEHPPRDLRSPRGWLATIARNVVRARLRSDQRRDRREQAAARPEAVPSAADIAARESIRSDVVDAVLGLEPIYRDVVLLRFYDDRPPREIARILDLPVETVRTREKRGLAKLRERLDARHGGDREAWCAALVPFTAALTKSVGGSVLTAVAALVLVIPLAWTWWIRADDAGLPATTRGPKALRVALQPTPTDPVAPIAADASVRESVVRRATLRGSLTTPAGGPAIGATVVACGARVDLDALRESRRAGDLVDAMRSVSTTTDTNGAFVLDGLEPGVSLLRATSATGDACVAYAVLFVEPALSMSAEIVDAIGGHGVLDDVLGACPRIEVHGDTTCALRLTSAGAVSGRVVDEDGHALADAEVFAFVPDFGVGPNARGWVALDEFLRLFAPLAIRSTTNANGEFELRGVLGNGPVIARAPGFLVDGTRVVVAESSTVRAELTLRRRKNAELRGRVRDPSGVAIADAQVYVTSNSAPAASMSDLQAAEQAANDGSRGTTTEVDGGFDFGRIPIADDGRFRLEPNDDELALIVVAPGFVPALVDDLDVDRIVAGPIEVVLEPARSIVVRAIDGADGVPIPGARVDVQRHELELFPALGTHATDLDGELHFDAFPARGGFVAVEAEGYFRADVSIPRGTTRLDVPLERARVVRVRVVDPDGELVSPMLEFDEPSAGLFSFGHTVRCVPYSLVALPFDPRTSALAESAVESWRFGAGDDIADARGGTVTIDGERKDVESITLPRSWSHETIWVAALSSTGVLASARVESVREVATLVVDLEAWKERIGWVGVRAIDASNGSPLAQFHTSVMRGGHMLPVAQSTARGSGVAWTLVAKPGVADVVVTADGFAPVVVPEFDVDSGEPGDPIVVRLEPAARVAGHVAGVVAGPYLPTVAAYDEHGFALGSAAVAADGAFELPQLPSGPVRLRMSDPGLGSCDVDVITQSGQTTQVTLAPSHPRNVRIALSGFESSPRTEVAIDFVDAAGIPLGVPATSLRAQDLADMRWSVPAGTWTIRVWTLRDGARVASATVPQQGEIVVSFE